MLMNLSHFGKSLKIPLWLKVDSCTQAFKNSHFHFLITVES